MFHIRSDEIGADVRYSDKQHKGNVGEGQFHINNETIAVHERNYMYQKLSYDELLEILS